MKIKLSIIWYQSYDSSKPKNKKKNFLGRLLPLLLRLLLLLCLHLRTGHVEFYYRNHQYLRHSLHTQR